MTQLSRGTSTVSPVVPEDNDPGDNPCLSCGACCAHFRVSFYFGELDSQPGGWVPVTLTSKVNDFRAAMKGTESGCGRCSALRGEVGQPGVSCSIYALRPTPCREFPAWEEDGTPNADCQRLRAGLGLPPLQPRLSARNTQASDAIAK